MTAHLNRRTAATSSLIIAFALSLLLTGAAVAPRAAHQAGASSSAALRALTRMISFGALRPGQPVPGAHPAKVGGLTQVSYYNWSGYADDNSTGTTYTSVSASWVQPSVTCPATEDQVAVFWVGLDGFNNGTVEQDGTMAQCFEGTAFYYTWWEMFPTNNIQIVGSDVAPGDHLRASVQFGANHRYSLKVTDSTTTDNSFLASEKCATGLTCANASAEWIAETPSYARGDAPLPTFTPWRATAAKVTGNGDAGVITSFPDDEITIVGVGGEHLANTGALSAGGNAFADTWHYTW